MNKLFVCFSHTLTSDQITSLEAEFGITQDNIIMIGDVNPELAATCQNINPFETFFGIELLAAHVVAEACKVQATHIMCMGEPALSTLVNSIAGKGEILNHFTEEYLLKNGYEQFDDVEMTCTWPSHFEFNEHFTCIQSTTQRTSVEETLPSGEVKKSSLFKHAMWRVWWK